jgi:RNA polymerase sigma factor (sigma-70 family)
VQAVHQNYGNGYIQEVAWDNSDSMILMSFLSTKHLPGGQTYNSLTVGKAGIKTMRPSKGWVRKNRKVDLVSQYIPLSKAIARDMTKKTGDREEVRQAAFMGLVEAASVFDEDDGVNFAVFARHRIRGAILDHWRNEQKEQGWSNQDDYFWESIADTYNSDDLDRNQRNLIDGLELAVEKLKTRRRRVIKARYLTDDPVPMKELASEMNVSERMIRYYVRLALDDLESELIGLEVPRPKEVQ